MSQARDRYEKAFADTVGAKAARAFALGRQALVVLLKALGLKEGDRVGLCGYTCLSVAEGVRAAGGVPVYLDVDEQLCISPQSLASLAPGCFKILILQHTFGLPGKLAELLGQAKRLGATVIEDCAHSLGGTWDGRPLGSFGAGAIYSFQWGKSYSTGQGGMLTANDPGLTGPVDDLIRALAKPMSFKADLSLAIQRSAYAMLSGLPVQDRVKAAYKVLARFGIVRVSFSEELPEVSQEGYVRTAGGLLCRAGLRQLGRWPTRMALRVRNAQTIADFLARNGLPTWPIDPRCKPVLLRYPLLVSNKSEVLASARSARLDIAGWYDSPVHPLKGRELEAVGYRRTCPNAEALIQRVVHFPTGLQFSPGMLDLASKVLHNQTHLPA